MQLEDRRLVYLLDVGRLDHVSQQPIRGKQTAPLIKYVPRDLQKQLLGQILIHPAIQ